MYFGGNSELRGYEYLQFLGQKAFFANAELRFPLIEAMLTPLGVLGGLRGVLFAGVGGAGYNGYDFTAVHEQAETYIPLLGYETDFLGKPTPVYGPPRSFRGSGSGTRVARTASASRLRCWACRCTSTGRTGPC